MTSHVVPLSGHPVVAPDVLEGFHMLEADAGTGKTWTIARLVLRALVEKSLRIDQIVVVTFTNAAAAELKDRIAALLDRWSDGVAPDDDPFSEAWQPPVEPARLREIVRLARLQLDDAPIHTIHGFCQRVLSEQAISLGQWGDIEPGFDDDAALTEALAQWWRREIVHGPASHSLLIGRYGLSFSRLKDLLRKALACPDADILSPSGVDWASLPDRIGEHVERLGLLLAAERDDLSKWMTQSGSLNKASYKPDQVDAKLDAVVAWVENFPQSIDFDLDELAWLDPRRMKILKKGIDRRDDFSVLSALAALNDMRVDRSQLNEQIGDEIRAEISARLEQQKRDARQISFDDLLHRTRRALSDRDGGPELARRLALRFPLALIDEFQDTDPAQWAIFNTIYLSSPPVIPGEELSQALVLVGDPKQAIYSFRNADVRTYLQARAAGANVYPLDENQRSGRALIHAVNAIFDRPQPFAVEQISFEPASAGSRADEIERQPPDDELGALSFVFLDGESDNPRAIGKPELGERAARICAAQVSRLLAGGESSVAAGDIAVLVRTLAQGRQVKQHLAAAGVGAVEVSRDSVLLADEATDLLRILAAVAAPADDRAVRGALTTALLGFCVNDLQQMGEAPGLWDKRFNAFFACQQAWARRGAQACLRQLLFGFFDRGSALVALPDGERRMTNLLHLLDLLSDAEAANESAVQARAILSRQRQWAIERQGRDETTEVRLESDDQLVRILTIHGSKGLEFPFVFLPYLWNTGGSFAMDQVLVNDVVSDDGGDRRVISLSPELKILKNPKWEIVPDGPLHPDSLKEASKQSALQEGLRLTYVALTRASRRCVVYWGFSQLAKRGNAAPGTLADPSPDAGGIGYLLDRECGLTDRPDVARVALRIRAMAEETDGITVSHWTDWLDQGADSIEENETHQAVPPPDHGVNADAARRVGWPAPLSLSLAQPIPRVPAPWRTTSFTGLMGLGALGALGSSGAATSEQQDAPELRPDHDESLADQLMMRVPETIGNKLTRTDFVRGANAGSCLHDILERVDFRLPLPPDIAKQSLSRFGIDESAKGVSNWLTEVLAAPLPAIEKAAGFSLNEIAPQDAIAELDFLLPIASADPAKIVAAVEKHYPVNGRFEHIDLSGFMKGFIDLVIRRDDTYWLLDWKSNWLSEDAGHYTHEAMAAAIASHGYSLQFCLYSLAMHRWLGHCISDYEYQSHFGGVYYLFLRGTGAPGTAADNGIFATRPPLSLILELESLMMAGQPQ